MNGKGPYCKHDFSSAEGVFVILNSTVRVGVGGLDSWDSLMKGIVTMGYPRRILNHQYTIR